MKTFQEERKKRHVIRDNSKNIAQSRSFKDRDTGGYHGARHPYGNLITVFPPKSILKSPTLAQLGVR
ncbi:hypothetical protein RD02_19340 [Pectobacterium brasiliense]|nr:hypothetical protein RD02_19340 [Pectobacterium brasiliense]